MSKKYCIFSAQYLPHLGGVERYTHHLARELIKLGNQVTVVTSKFNGFPYHSIAEEIEIYRMPSFNFMDNRLPVLKYNKHTKQIIRELKEKEFDFVLINTRFYFLSLYGAVFAKKNGIEAAVVEHGTSHLTFHNRVLDRIEKIYEHGITAILKHYCKNYYGVSKACCKWSRHFGIEPKGVLYNCIDVEEIEKLVQIPVQDYKKDYEIQDGDIVITFTGRLLIEKGVYELLDACTSLNVDRNVVLFMAGDGPEADNISKKAGKFNNGRLRIIPLGQIDFLHIVALLKATEIYCLPSVSEGFPTSVLEAVAAKCFVITTYNGGTRELIKDGKSGRILENNSADGLCKALEETIRDDAFRHRAIEKAYNDLKEGFTWQSTAKELIRISDGK